MNPIGCNNRACWVAVVALLLLCLPLVGILAFRQGKTSAERRAEIQMANNDAFYSLFALRALNEPQKEKSQVLFQVGLDASALKLAEMCLSHPEMIGNTNYNLLVQIQRYLDEHGKAPDRNPGLRPVGQVAAKIREATAKLESIHPDRERWEAEESGRAETTAASK